MGVGVGLVDGEAVGVIFSPAHPEMAIPSVRTKSTTTKLTALLTLLLRFYPLGEAILKIDFRIL